MLKKKLLIFGLSFLLLALGVRIAIFWKQRFNKLTTPQDIESIKVLDLASPFSSTSKSTSNTGASLAVLSANLIAEFEPTAATTDADVGAEHVQPLQETAESTESGEASSDADVGAEHVQPLQTPTPSLPPPPPSKIKTLRILGEIENRGSSEIKSATPIITFLDDFGTKIAAKIGVWSENYIFPVLKPKEKYFYDVVLKDIPDNFTNISISFKSNPSNPSTPSNPSISSSLKILDRTIDENTATSSAGLAVNYWRLKGEMINLSENPMKNTRVVAYVKDEQSRVFGWQEQSFPSDLFSQNQRAQISILLFPFKEGKLENVEVYLFGEEL